LDTFCTLVHPDFDGIEILLQPRSYRFRHTSNPVHFKFDPRAWTISATLFTSISTLR
jgi:hypothetical protein